MASLAVTRRASVAVQICALPDSAAGWQLSSRKTSHHREESSKNSKCGEDPNEARDVAVASRGTPNKATALVNAAFSATTSNPGLLPLDCLTRRGSSTIDFVGDFLSRQNFRTSRF
jgi:hypothetical protein